MQTSRPGNGYANRHRLAGDETRRCLVTDDFNRFSRMMPADGAEAGSVKSGLDALRTRKR